MNIKNILTASVLILSLNLCASTVEPTLTTGNNKTFTVDLADWATQDVEVKITDLEGHILVAENLHGAGKIYNLRQLESGTYYVAVSNATKIINTTLSVSEGSVKIAKSDVFYRPMVSIGTNHFDVSSLTQGWPVSVSISDNNGDIFYANYKETPVINKRFSMALLPSGEYQIAVRKGTDVKTYSITK